MDIIGGVLMKDNNNMVRLGLVVLLFIASTSISAKNDDATFTTDKVGDLVIQVNQAFDEAEKSVLGTNPDPPNPEPLGPDPDPDKCICKGTGIITHGDGHTTDCPYHKKVDDTTVCAEDCKSDCDESCNCANTSGCIQQATYQQEIIEKKYDYNLYVFSANFCGPCKRLDREVWQNLVNDKIYTKDTHKEIKNFLEQQSVKFQKYIWENEKDKKFFRENSVNRFPTMILKKDGRVVLKTVGFYNKSSFKSLISNKTLKGR